MGSTNELSVPQSNATKYSNKLVKKYIYYLHLLVSSICCIY